jgi:hypothetical protein
VILRVIRGRAERGRVVALRDAIEARLGAGPATTEGPDRFHIVRRPADGVEEVLVLACWPSPEAAERADARGISPLRLAAQYLDELKVQHFEVDMNMLREPDIRPVAARIATGRFSRPGGDIRMQELLRERLPSLGAEMIEAYVGRRLAGRGVDVTFVSLWGERPQDHPLEDPFWQDISVRYDEFSVEVYGPVD